jgi:hypothetical protein
MAENKLLLMNTSQSNILSDDELIDTDWDTDGIYTNEVAYSDRMNAILRQLTSVTHPLADLVSSKLNKNIGSYNDVGNSIEAITTILLEDTMKAITLEVAPSKLTVRTPNTLWAGPSSGTTAQAPTFRALVPTDIPTLDAAKITTGTFGTDFITNSAITTDKINNLAVTTAKINNLAVTAGKLAADSVETAKIKDKNVTFAKLPDSAEAGLSVLGRNTNTTGSFGELAAETDGHVLRRSGAALGFGTIASAGIANEAVTKAKLSKTDILIADGTKVLDSLISDKHSSVIGYTGPTGTTLGQFYIRKVTQAEYTALETPDNNTLYLIVG